MTVFQIDPLQDTRWTRFVLERPKASVFHTPGWLEALRRTYGYQPVVFTTSPPDRELENGIAFCRVNSGLTGRRLVSLPFSDHCEPLVDRPEDLQTLLDSAAQELVTKRLRYIELRPASPDLTNQTGFVPDHRFWSHKLDLQPSLTTLFSRLHKNCVQRKVRRAEREGIICKSGSSESLLQHFYDLVLSTRRRQGLPPQPLRWFQHLRDCLRGMVTIYVAYKAARPVAGIFTLKYKHVLLYKYGASDKQYSALGGMQLLLWQAMTDAKQDHILEFDLGRADRDNVGLCTFKDHLGATRFPLIYWRCPRHAAVLSRGWAAQTGRLVCASMPRSLLATIGNVLYKHAG